MLREIIEGGQLEFSNFTGGLFYISKVVLWLGEISEGDSADTRAGKFAIVLMRG
jgi:hypothetical protein